MVRSRYLTLIYFSVHCLRQQLLPYPLDRSLLSVVTLMFILVVHLLALIYNLMSVLYLLFYKLQLKKSCSRIKIRLNLKPQFQQAYTVREFKSRILNSVHVTIKFKYWVYNIIISTQNKSMVMGMLFYSQDLYCLSSHV